MTSTHIFVGLGVAAVLAFFAAWIWFSAWNQNRLMLAALRQSEEDEKAGNLSAALRSALAAEDMWTITNASLDELAGWTAHLDVLESIVRRISDLASRSGNTTGQSLTTPVLKAIDRLRQFVAAEVGTSRDYRGRLLITSGSERITELYVELGLARSELRKYRAE